MSLCKENRVRHHIESYVMQTEMQPKYFWTKFASRFSIFWKQ